MIGVLDLRIGNLFSVVSAIEWLGFDCIEVREAYQLSDLSHLIIPGVGHFSAAIQNINTQKLLEPLHNYIKSARPVLGICLGMQLFADYSVEGQGDVSGLSLIKATIVPFDIQPNLHVPHIGWNSVEFLRDHPITEGLKNNRDYYFVHSFYYKLQHERHQIAATNYGDSFPSIVGADNVVGVQFHPEKSQKNGLALLENFARWDGQC